VRDWASDAFEQNEIRNRRVKGRKKGKRKKKALMEKKLKKNVRAFAHFYVGIVI
jgi:hypothetical protein